MYACIGLLYQSYMVYFYLEIALELWGILFNTHIQSLSDNQRLLLQGETFFSRTCSLSIYHHPNLRLLNWYGPDIFHTTLVIRYILMNDSKKQLTRYIQQYISLDTVYLAMKFIIIFCGFFAILRTTITSCFLLDKLYKLARVG